MPSIRTVNLVWERKVRGSYAVSRFALDDAGAVTLALPRPFENRAYDLTRIALDGAAIIRATFSVETLLEMEASAESDSVIGMTSDDLYLIHAGSKSRFLPERHIIFVDSALSMDGRMVVACFSDRSGSNFALGAGDITGRIQWLHEADAPLSAVAVSPEGGLICLAAETGAIRLLDTARREYWLFEQDKPVRALACAPRGRFTAYGTARGGLGLIDSDGSRIWDAELPGDIVSLAVSADGGLVAALVRPAADEGTTHLCVLDAAGHIGWDFEADRRLVGLALAPGGRYLATSGRDGTHTLYEVVPGQPGSDEFSVAAIDETVRQAEQCHEQEDLAGAVRLLRKALDERPAEVAACERLLAIQEQHTSRLLAEARAYSDREEFAAALETLSVVKSITPDEPELYTLQQDVRRRWERKAIQSADSALAVGDLNAAETALKEILSFAPHSLEARRRLASIEAGRARDADAEAERTLAAGNIEAALESLERGQQSAPSAERAEKLRRAQIDLEFAGGMKAYNEKRYREATFQFKKVLARDPNHAEALRQLNFAQRFEQDANEALTDRFSRLE